VTEPAASTSFATALVVLDAGDEHLGPVGDRAGVALHLGEVGLDGGLDGVEVDGLLGRGAQVVDRPGRLARDVGDVVLGLAVELVGLTGYVGELGLGRVEDLLALVDAVSAYERMSLAMDTVYSLVRELGMALARCSVNVVRGEVRRSLVLLRHRGAGCRCGGQGFGLRTQLGVFSTDDS